jgi:hypothetical protein
MATALDGDLAECRLDHLWTDGRHLVAMVGVDDQLDGVRIVALRHLGIGDRVGVAGLPGNEPDEPLSAALGEVEPEMIGQRPMIVGPLCGLEELGDLGHVMRRKLPLDIESTHVSRLLVILGDLVTQHGPIGVAASPGRAQ